MGSQYSVQRWLAAAEGGNVAEARDMLRKAKHLTLIPSQEEGETALHIAARRGDIAFLRMLLDELGTFGSVDQQDKRGRTPLMAACEAPCPIKDREEMALMLLECHPRLDLIDHEGRNALHYTVPGGLEEATAALLQALDHPPPPPAASSGSGRFQGRAWGPSDVINGASVDGVTPLHLALSVARDEHGDRVALRLASLLVGKGAMPTRADTGGVTPLLLARHWPDGRRVLRPVVGHEVMEEGERLFEALHRDPIPTGATSSTRERKGLQETGVEDSDDAMNESNGEEEEEEEDDDDEEEEEDEEEWAQGGKRKAVARRPRVDRRSLAREDREDRRGRKRARRGKAPKEEESEARGHSGEPSKEAMLREREERVTRREESVARREEAVARREEEVGKARQALETHARGPKAQDRGEQAALPSRRLTVSFSNGGPPVERGSLGLTLPGRTADPIVRLPGVESDTMDISSTGAVPRHRLRGAGTVSSSVLEDAGGLQTGTTKAQEAGRGSGTGAAAAPSGSTSGVPPRPPTHTRTALEPSGTVAPQPSMGTAFSILPGFGVDAYPRRLPPTSFLTTLHRDPAAGEGRRPKSQGSVGSSTTRPPATTGSAPPPPPPVPQPPARPHPSSMPSGSGHSGRPEVYRGGRVVRFRLPGDSPPRTEGHEGGSQAASLPPAFGSLRRQPHLERLWCFRDVVESGHPTRPSSGSLDDHASESNEPTVAPPNSPSNAGGMQR